MLREGEEAGQVGSELGGAGRSQDGLWGVKGQVCVLTDCTQVQICAQCTASLYTYDTLEYFAGLRQGNEDDDVMQHHKSGS